jgi:hypothetical protein
MLVTPFPDPKNIMKPIFITVYRQTLLIPKVKQEEKVEGEETGLSALEQADYPHRHHYHYVATVSQQREPQPR